MFQWNDLFIWFISNLAWSTLVYIATVLYSRIKEKPIKTLQIIVGGVLASTATTLGFYIGWKTSYYSSIITKTGDSLVVSYAFLFGFIFIMTALEDIFHNISFGKSYIPFYVASALSIGLSLIIGIVSLLYFGTLGLLSFFS